MRLMVSGGGTGGHIYPALALIERLKQVEPDTEVLYVGAKRGLETKIVPQAGYRLETMEVQGFRRSLSLENVKTVYLFLKAVAQAKKLIRDFRPDVVLGTGGYVSGAVLYAAAKLGVPTVIHEQNSVVGVTNKFLARYVNEVAIAFEAARSQFAKSSVTMTGNPRAQQVAQRTNSAYSWTEDGLKDGVPTIMIFGGSQGAPRINKAVVEALPSFNEQPYQVIFATGQKRYDDVMRALAGQPIGDNVKVVPYIEDMPDKLPHVDALVSRAGATTIAEVTALGIPTILIPSPYVTANHQVKNAEALVKKGAALMILEDQLDGRSLITQANHLMNDAAVRQKMAANSKAVGHPDASDQLIAVLKKAIADHQK
ncbi:undecaprenyldiphospho-muramoylpentapeptide beta-N-acetylglucosaminyltransferase [Limosilactobacillus fermentum]|uniref:UDP-N-acetylglucosamine--N-acetylmuramyl-(pentapeptide) pyrophosphoryl-undecaprenol N-acetylglucosamine transferase n=1 Tax=Limosilactobacillus fermentum TaxID=1613 RepID=A0ABD0AJL6_LIMFE|nr:undecaprenyldiphospho-muramoylpentapeptide beta-N-acetylglucosaminyltransferase [Limosilactobacillus fermentum]PHI33950.1 undecaprenyldiphospho-muramoylpentapeptide beta-N-acetylglucosaminyltransferase [Limosilactobacillus fermentum]CDN26188.1 K02563 UDP-N-acetylglucosamine--N-acetylmuramyl-(pentapeptide) pyrophosphoryl-undecaprenol N-acetylglucosamine transferase [Limosilactobacillus fermentum]SJM48016.1 UDP-N-acetylglucosamine--N-acetylmuramyl-(pentapeptide) pyrophosphoryl-undecaprenol N-ac